MIFETETCTGCQSCEIACSYHHKKIFRPMISSIHVSDQAKERGLVLSLLSQDEGLRIACDDCAGLDEPLCVKYCSPVFRDQLKNILEKFRINR